MAADKMSTMLVISTVLILAGLSHALEKDCSMDQVKVLSKMVTCITKHHPEYFLTVLTKMDNPTAMESPDFMCSNPGMMSALVECFLEYVEGCMPPSLSSQVSSVMPTPNTIEKGVKFLCNHRKAFQHPCVTSQMVNVVQCIHKKMESFTATGVSYSISNKHSVHNALCLALNNEKQCLSESLKDCPAAVASDITTGLLAFFASENCDEPPEVDTVLRFKSLHGH